MPKANYRPQLDSLRAIAVFAVFVHHYLPVNRVIPTDFINLGLLGVRLFFVLSGYLITGILLRYRTMTLGAALKTFYTRRALRILPTYYLTVLFAAIFIPVFRASLAWHLVYGANFLQLFHSNAWIGHFWTLAVEEQFYFVWPFAILLAPYRRIPKIIVGVIAAGVVFTIVATWAGWQLGDFILTPACLDSLGIGALLALVEHDQARRVYRDRFLQFALGAGLIIVALQSAAYFSGHLHPLWASFPLGVSLIFVWIIGRASYGFTGKAGELLELRPIVYLGRISYGLYLYHFFMPDIVRWAARGLSLGYPRAVSTFFLASGFSIVAAAASWYLIEKPIAGWKDRLSGPGAILAPAAGSIIHYSASSDQAERSV